MENVTIENGLYRFNDLLNFFDGDDSYLEKAIRNFIISTGNVPKDCYVSEDNMNYFISEYKDTNIVIVIRDTNKSYFKAEKIPGQMLDVRINVKPESLLNGKFNNRLRNNEAYLE